MKQLIYIITLFISSLSLAQNEAIFDQANALYNEGNYEAALGKYNTILESGQHSAALYFNIANAHYRLNHIAPSIYYFEKALLLKPNDKEIKNNIVYARNMTIDDIDDIPEVGFSRLVTNTTNLMSFDNWAKTAIGMVVLFIVLFLIYYFSESTSKKRFAFVSSMLSILIAFLALGFAFHKYELVEKNQPAIVFAVETPIKSEPNLRSPEAFKLHEGTKVQVLDTVSNWKRIELSDGKTGWVSSDAIRMLKDF